MGMRITPRSAEIRKSCPRKVSVAVTCSIIRFAYTRVVLQCSVHCVYKLITGQTYFPPECRRNTAYSWHNHSSQANNCIISITNEQFLYFRGAKLVQKIQELPLNSRQQKSDMNQVLQRRLTNIRCHSTKFSALDDMSPRIFPP